MKSFLSNPLASTAPATTATPAPPPPDYFLGFSSPGTQIWARLRSAGLETKRVYALDTRRVMIKLRCPAERLEDVAEVLRMKLKTKDGSYLPYREGMRKKFVGVGDSVSRMDMEEVRFKSSERQKIIDFIIRSRIRDSGAELDERTGLGKNINLKMPLHMHARLEGLFSSWVTYWSSVNWEGDRLTFQHSVPTSSANPASSVPAPLPDLEMGKSAARSRRAASAPPPGLFVRIFKGAFHQPLDNIASYYGEGVSFYFAWMQHSSKYLLLPAFFGSIQFIAQICLGDWDPPTRPFFALFIMLWSFVVMVTWRQRSNFLAHRWGTLNYEEEEGTRPQYKGDYIKDLVTGEWTIAYAPWKRWLKYAVSIPLTIGFTVGSLLFMLLAYANRDIILARYFDPDFDNTNSNMWSFSLSIIVQHEDTNITYHRDHLRNGNFWLIALVYPVAIGMFLPLVNFFFTWLSIKLNDFENYRTDSEYRNHLILKVFTFRFVNYFAALYYYAFLTANNESSIFRVASGVFVYITVAHWWNICMTIWFPHLVHRWRLYNTRRKLMNAVSGGDGDEEDVNRAVLLEQAQSTVWEETMLPEYDTFDDFVYAVMQFSYVACFSVVFPLTPLIVLVNQVVQIRLDAYKLCRARRRPLSEKAGGIGVWEHVLHIVTVLAVLTNCALMATTSSFLRGLIVYVGDVGLYLIVVSIEHGILLVKYWLQASISEYSVSVKASMRKERFLSSKRRNSNMRAKKDRRNSGDGGGGKERDEEEREEEELLMEEYLREEEQAQEAAQDASQERVVVVEEDEYPELPSLGPSRTESPDLPSSPLLAKTPEVEVEASVSALSPTPRHSLSPKSALSPKLRYSMSPKPTLSPRYSLSPELNLDDSDDDDELPPMPPTPPSYKKERHASGEKRESRRLQDDEDDDDLGDLLGPAPENITGRTRRRSHFIQSPEGKMNPFQQHYGSYVESFEEEEKEKGLRRRSPEPEVAAVVKEERKNWSWEDQPVGRAGNKRAPKKKTESPFQKLEM